MLSDDFTIEQLAVVEPEVLNTEATATFPDDIIAQVYGGRSAHHGIRRTWLLLNKTFSWT